MRVKVHISYSKDDLDSWEEGTKTFFIIESPKKINSFGLDRLTQAYLKTVGINYRECMTRLEYLPEHLEMSKQQFLAHYLKNGSISEEPLCGNRSITQKNETFTAVIKVDNTYYQATVLRTKYYNGASEVEMLDEPYVVIPEEVKTTRYVPAYKQDLRKQEGQLGSSANSSD